MTLKDPETLKCYASSLRCLVLKPKAKPGRVPDFGLLDTRVFEGGNNIYAYKDPVTKMWSLRYANGIIPPGLQGRYTSFDELLNSASVYFNKKNIEIIDVVDVDDA